MIGSPLEVAPLDPTEPSSAEILGEWELAIRSMTFEQGMERVLCMFLRDRERAREHMEKAWGDNWIQHDTLMMEKYFNAIYGTHITHFGYNSTVRVIAEKGRELFSAVIFPPWFNDRGWPTLRRFDKSTDFMSTHSGSEEIGIYDVDGEFRFNVWDESGRRPKTERDFIDIVIECSQFFGLPVIPFECSNMSIRKAMVLWKKPFISKLVDCPIEDMVNQQIRDFIEGVVPEEFRREWLGAEQWYWRVRFLDGYNPGWRERVRRTGSLWLEQEKA